MTPVPEQGTSAKIRSKDGFCAQAFWGVSSILNVSPNRALLSLTLSRRSGLISWAVSSMSGFCSAIWHAFPPGAEHASRTL